MAKSLTKEENILLTLINAFQNDEKEKLNHLVNISKSLIEVRKKVKEEMEKLPPQFNVFNSINLLNHENYNSNLFANFLEIKFKHNGNKISFAKLFLKYLTEEFGWEFDLENIKIEDIEIKRELPTEERKRIDIFIGYKEKFAVIIENKIWADDGYKQLENYYNHVKSQKYDKIYMIYLTPYEREPSEESLSKELYKEKGSKLYGKFANIKHAEIGYWLEGILKRQEFSFLNNEEENNKYNYKLLKSALIQIIDNEKSISGENEEGDLTETEIKKVLKENLFKELETKGELTESELDKYFEMFDKAKSLLVKEKITIIIKKYLKFTKEVNKYLNKNIKYELTSDKDIINNINMVNENSTNNIDNIYFKFKVNKIEINICDWHEWNKKNNNSYIYSEYCIAIYKGNKSTKNKLKKLEDNIKNIFYNWQFYDQDDYNRYAYLVNNVEEVSPKETAEAINKLYELLKKEIK